MYLLCVRDAYIEKIKMENYAMKELRKKLSKNIKLEYLYTAINGLNMVNFVWVLYLSYRGMNLAQIGILEGIYHGASMLFEILTGAIADLFGRKSSMIAGRLCIAISCIMMLFASKFWMFAIVFVIQAWGNNFNSGSEEALVFDSVKLLGEENKYLRINGRIQVLIEAAQAIATVLGGILAEYSYMYCYITCFVIAVFSITPILFMTEPPIEKQENHNIRVHVLFINHFKESIELLFGDVRILRLSIFYSGIFTLGSILYFYGQPYLYDIGFNRMEIGCILMCAGIAAALGAFFSDALYRRTGDKIVPFYASVLCGCIIAFGYVNGVAAIGVFMVFEFLSSVLYPIQSNTMNTLIPSDKRATLISVNSMCCSIMMVVVFPMIGKLIDLLGMRKVLTVVGTLCLLGIIMYLKNGAYNKNKSTTYL